MKPHPDRLMSGGSETRLLKTSPIFPQMIREKQSLQTLAGVMNPVQFRGEGNPQVKSLTTDSRRIIPGSLFFALPGLRTDGNFYSEEAIDRGAVGIVTEQSKASHRKISTIQVENVHSALAAASRHFYGDPASRLPVIGITGTNGKTTVALLAQHLLAEKDQPVGLIGTIRYDVGRRTFPSFKTTPESVDVYAMLAQMEEAGCREAVMEISSHGIHQKRVEGLKLDIAVFLNLTQDHLDYHGDLESYFECKTRIFTGKHGQPLPGSALINRDDPRAIRLLGAIPESVEVHTFGLNPHAGLRAEAISMGRDGTHFTLVGSGKSHPVWTPLLGSYNVSNTLAALSIGLARGRNLQEMVERLRKFPGVPGRMERIDSGQPFQVLVDYAHTDDALRNAIGMLRPLVKETLRVVFGCGGNRDREKRPLMTRAVLDSADVAYLTADNPRNEEVGRILDDMEGGVRPGESARVVRIEDRRQAIRQALTDAGPEDCVLIAGKGHESFQEFSDTLVPFDDRAVARELLSFSKLAEQRTGRASKRPTIGE